MELIFVGDIHGNFPYIAEVAKRASQDAVIIQLGDFGFYPSAKEEWDSLNIKKRIDFIEGNHEHYPSLIEKYSQHVDNITEVWKNLFHIRRGTVWNFGGKNIAFCGGAGSIDKSFRTPGIDWFPEEAISDDDLKRFDNAPNIDLLITHCPPISVINANLNIFKPKDKVKFGVSEDWVDYSQIQVQRLWEKLGWPPIICGHMHNHIDWNVSIPNHIRVVSQVKILNINEIYTITL